MSLLIVSEIGRKEGESWVLKNICFAQAPFQKIAIAGSTGSGKTTLLKIISGLTPTAAGEVLFYGERVKGPHEKLFPGHPGISYQSQYFELRNNYRVGEILQMANKLSEPDAALVYEICRIDHLLSRRTDELSGGEKQRIAFAKTLVSSPKLLLLDEPFSNLDAIHRNILKEVINDIASQLKVTCMLVSHDPVDLLSWADEIIVLHHGVIVQKDTPEEIYLRPLNGYVAGLFGNYTEVTPGLTRLFPSISTKRFLRPQNFVIENGTADGLEAVVKSIRFMGGYYEIEVGVCDNVILVYSDKRFEKGTLIRLALNNRTMNHSPSAQ